MQQVAAARTGQGRDPLNTPMIRQYLELKASVPGCLLFFRMGDFYEMFLEDAQTAAPLLGIQLTSRNKGDPDEVPLCGFPYHQLDEYLAKMVLLGRKVAIGEQVEVSENGKRFFKREITRVVTPGLVTQGEAGLGAEAQKPRYLAAVLVEPLPKKNAVDQIGIAYVDIATGEFRVFEFQHERRSALQRITDEIARLGPSEILLPESQRDGSLGAWIGGETGLQIPISFRGEKEFDVSQAVQRLERFLSVQTLDGFGVSGYTIGLGAAAAIAAYVNETQRSGARHLRTLLPYRFEETVHLDAATRRNLEITRNTRDGMRRDSLLATIDRCLTRQGSRLLEQWLTSPLFNINLIEQRLAAVEEFVRLLRDADARLERLEALFKEMGDLERICARLALGTATPRDVFALGQSLTLLPEMLSRLDGLKGDLFTQARSDLAQPDLFLIAQQILRTLSDAAPLQTKDGGFVREGFHPELDELRLLMRDTKGFIAEIEREERQKTGISSLKVRYNKVFGYYLEVSKSNLKQVPDYFIRKQTLVNAERFIVPALKTFEEKLLHAEERAQSIELTVFRDLKEEVTHFIPQIAKASQAVAGLDVLLTFGRNAFQWNYVRPSLCEERVISIQEGRHPVLERLGREERFVANDLEMDAEKRQILLITGPNMAGKSTVMRQLALIVLLAQCGSFVPAAQARLGLVDGIFTRVGASDYLTLGQSTFMVEMTETANILHNATKRSLVLLDEIGRGTSTYDGLSLAWALAEHLHDKIGARTLFATHYHELAELPKTRPRIVNCNIAVKEWNDRIVFLRKLVDGATNRSYGIQVARLAGVPEAVLGRAREILETLQEGGLDVFGRPLLEKDKPGKPTSNQFDLFAGKRAALDFQGSGPTTEQREILDAVADAKVDEMTPLQALNFLQALQARQKH